MNQQLVDRLGHIENAQTRQGAVIADVKTDVARIEAAQSRQGADIAQLKSHVSQIHAVQDKQGSDIAEIKSAMSAVLQLLARIDGRMEEQSRTINALIPVRLAAVGER